MPMRHLPSYAPGDSSRRVPFPSGSVEENNDAEEDHLGGDDGHVEKADMDRRQFFITTAAVGGALVVGLGWPRRAGRWTQPRPAAPWVREPSVREINAWIVVAPDDTVTIRIAQTELGQGVWTSNAMMVGEELQCDWSKVRRSIRVREPRRAREGPRMDAQEPRATAPPIRGGGVPTFGNRDRTGVSGIPDSLYRRMRTNAASSVKGRPLLPAAGRRRSARAAAAGGRDDCGTCRSPS